jgi:hypothetical protein
MPKKIVAAVSTDGGLTWTDHVALDVSGFPGNEILGDLFPWVTFDRAGNLYAMGGLGGTGATGSPTNGMYYSVSTDKGQTWSPMRKINAAPDQGDRHGTWTIHFAQSRNATSAKPTFTEVKGPAVRTGAVCTLGILCDGNRALADFMEIALDSFGYAHVAAPATDAADQVYDVYWRQDAGPSATTDPCQPACVKKRPGPRP